MRKWLWIAPMLAAAGWSQPQRPIPAIISEAPVNGFTIPSGTELNVRIGEALSTERNVPGDRFTATLVDPVMGNGSVVLPEGTRLTGHVLANLRAGIWKGWAKLLLGLDSFQLNGRTFHIELTAAMFEDAHKHKKLEFADPNAKSVVATPLAVTIPAGMVVHFALGAPVLAPVGQA